MKVVDYFKQKRDGLSLHAFELKDLLSPSLREHWLDFVNRANKTQLGALLCTNSQHLMMMSSSNLVRTR